MGQEDSFHLSAEYAGESQEVGLHVGWREIAISLIVPEPGVVDVGIMRNRELRYDTERNVRWAICAYVGISLWRYPGDGHCFVRTKSAS
jgi:hypothetical protein